MGDSGGLILAEAIAKSVNLKNLKLIKNKLTDEAGIAIANALQSNNSIHTLNLT